MAAKKKKILRVRNNRDSVLSLSCKPILDKKKNLLMPVRVILQPGWNNIDDNEVEAVTEVLKIPLSLALIEKGYLVVEDSAKKTGKASMAELNRELAKERKKSALLSDQNDALKKEIEALTASIGENDDQKG